MRGARGGKRFCLIPPLIVYAAASFGQELEFPISPSPVGSGARAAGMADAFVAIADDATAASWNPAGLVQLERPEISIVGSFNAIREEFQSAPIHPEFPSTHTDNNFDLNFFSVTYPLRRTLGGRNITLSLAYQQKFDLSRTFNVDFFTEQELVPGQTLFVNQDIDFNQDGSLVAWSPAVAMEITRTLSVGVAVNLWRDTIFADSGWTQTISRVGESHLNDTPPQPFEFTAIDEYRNVKGENVSVGLLWNVTNRWNVGIRYDSPLRADADFTRTEIDSRFGTLITSEQRQLRIPDTWAFGVSWRPNDRLTLSLDISRTDWDDFYFRTADGERISLVDASSIDDPAQRIDFDPTTTVRLGFEYLFIPEILEEKLPRLWTLRGGAFFDQEPASGRSTLDPAQPGDGKPDNFYGITAGVGLLVQQRVNIDFAYQARIGFDVNSDFIRGVPGFKEDVLQHRLLLSTVVYF